MAHCNECMRAGVYRQLKLISCFLKNVSFQDYSSVAWEWGQDAHRELPYMVSTVIWVMKSLSDLADDSKDRSGKPANVISTSLTL